MRYEQITTQQREDIALKKAAGASQGQIARDLGRPSCTIGRELRRNGGAEGYRAARAQAMCGARRRGRPLKRKLDHPSLRDYINEHIVENRWSPGCISGRLAVHEKHKTDPAMQVSHETLYRFIWAEHHAGRRTLSDALWQGRRKRRHRYSSRNHKRLHHETTSIEQRPPVVDGRSRLGDLEADSVCGPVRSPAALVTLVERKSRYLFIAKVADRKAATCNDALMRCFAQLPQMPRHTLTVDNGMEFSVLKPVEEKLGLKVFHAHPYHAWERGQNEQVNGLLRKFFPKGRDLRDVTQEDIDRAAHLINTRPRKVLNYRTPLEVLHQDLRRVALEN